MLETITELITNFNNNLTSLFNNISSLSNGVSPVSVPDDVKNIVSAFFPVGLLAAAVVTYYVIMGILFAVNIVKNIILFIKH